MCVYIYMCVCVCVPVCMCVCVCICVCVYLVYMYVCAYIRTVQHLLYGKTSDVSAVDRPDCTSHDGRHQFACRPLLP